MGTIWVFVTVSVVVAYITSGVEVGPMITVRVGLPRVCLFSSGTVKIPEAVLVVTVRLGGTGNQGQLVGHGRTSRVGEPSTCLLFIGTTRVDVLSCKISFSVVEDTEVGESRLVSGKEGLTIGPPGVGMSVGHLRNVSWELKPVVSSTISLDLRRKQNYSTSW